MLALGVFLVFSQRQCNKFGNFCQEIRIAFWYIDVRWSSWRSLANSLKKTYNYGIANCCFFAAVQTPRLKQGPIGTFAAVRWHSRLKKLQSRHVQPLCEDIGFHISLWKHGGSRNGSVRVMLKHGPMVSVAVLCLCVDTKLLYFPAKNASAINWSSSSSWYSFERPTIRHQKRNQNNQKNKFWSFNTKPFTQKQNPWISIICGKLINLLSFGLRPLGPGLLLPVSFVDRLRHRRIPKSSDFSWGHPTTECLSSQLQNWYSIFLGYTLCSACCCQFIKIPKKTTHNFISGSCFPIFEGHFNDRQVGIRFPPHWDSTRPHRSWCQRPPRDRSPNGKCQRFVARPQEVAVQSPWQQWPYLHHLAAFCLVDTDIKHDVLVYTHFQYMIWTCNYKSLSNLYLYLSIYLI